MLLFSAFILASSSVDTNSLSYSDILTTEQITNVRTILSHYSKDGSGYGETWTWLANLTDTVGSRKVGSDGYRKAVEYLLPRLRQDGFTNVNKEVVNVPNWVRGNEEAYLVSPRRKALPILGLGSTVSTPVGGVTAEAIVARDWEQADALGEAGLIKGKILVFNPVWKNYGYNTNYRRRGATYGAKHGALVTLIRSAASHSIASPHTGQQDYDSSYPKIPTACLSVEDAALIDRMTSRGQRVVIYVNIPSHPGTPEEVPSWNVVSELRGSAAGNRYVLISGHLDSWDVGQGAMDDGGGVAICRQAMYTLKKLGITPKRTIRAVFWTAEEPGLQGSKGYYDRHKNDKMQPMMVMESDNGAFTPVGFRFKGTDNQRSIMAALMPLFDGMNATTLSNWENGEDVNFWMTDGIPGGTLDVRHWNDYYFKYHHSEGDTMSVFQEGVLDSAAAMWTVVAYLVADIGEGFIG